MTFRPALSAALGVVALFASAPAPALDLTGAWASDPGSCGKLFAKKGAATVFKGNSDLYGNGFIVAGNQIRSPFTRCRVTAKKEDGSAIHLLAACSTDIMLSNVQFSLKVVDDNTIIRHFPGLEEIEVQYSRCP
jgi:hypothetical protein